MKPRDQELYSPRADVVEELLAHPAGAFGDADFDVRPVFAQSERVHGECAFCVHGVRDALMRLFGVLPGAGGWVGGFEGFSCDWSEPTAGAEEVQGCGVVGGDVSRRLGWWLDLRLIRLAVSRV